MKCAYEVPCSRELAVALGAWCFGTPWRGRPVFYWWNGWMWWIE